MGIVNVVYHLRLTMQEAVNATVYYRNLKSANVESWSSIISQDVVNVSSVHKPTVISTDVPRLVIFSPPHSPVMKPTANSDDNGEIKPGKHGHIRGIASSSDAGRSVAHFVGWLLALSVSIYAK